MWFSKHKIKIIVSALAVVVICTSADLGGELIGVQGRQVSKKEIPPYGMVLIPQGTFIMGLNDQDPFSAMDAPLTTASVDAFWIDQTEITNNEYRQFVQYVIDSISRRVLGEQFDEFLIIEDAFGNPIDPPMLNWNTPINPKNTDYMEALNAMYTPPSQGLGVKALNVTKLVYNYKWIDYNIIIGRRPAPQVLSNDQNVLSQAVIEENISIYPDTMVWLRDFDYSYNDPFAFRYFAHPAYDDYPVVGVTWKQATAFCDWRTRIMVDYNEKNKRFSPHIYRLPTEAEWEYAARGGLQQQKYPWGGPYTYNKQGCYLANFLPQREKHGIDGGIRTLPVGSYQANDFGLYDMAGNAAEWTSSAYDEQSYKFVSGVNPSYQFNAKDNDPLAMKRKVIRGGSWKDISHFLQCGARTFEYQDTAKSYI
ncbi:MAG: SUMF1/EgtB/PvdO family nonheme iron enzyme, partial [Prevotellaceae bacterium]|nr:SUMF1/EgtB/PvdO family nonheme iron enzyme [Prevotellaceae bacterium]